jgi:hypothetical protein
MEDERYKMWRGKEVKISGRERKERIKVREGTCK